MSIQSGSGVILLRSCPHATDQVLSVDLIADQVWLPRWPQRGPSNPSLSALASGIEPTKQELKP
jgi:hypothetical protein